MNSSGSGLALGLEGNGYPYYSGLLDNVVIWSSALTQSEFQDITPPLPNDTDIIGYWTFEEGSGDTTEDITGNGNTGTIYGATWSSDTP